MNRAVQLPKVPSGAYALPLLAVLDADSITWSLHAKGCNAVNRLADECPVCTAIRVRWARMPGFTITLSRGGQAHTIDLQVRELRTAVVLSVTEAGRLSAPRIREREPIADTNEQANPDLGTARERTARALETFPEPPRFDR